MAQYNKRKQLEALNEMTKHMTPLQRLEFCSLETCEAQIDQWIKQREKEKRTIAYSKSKNTPTVESASPKQKRKYTFKTRDQSISATAGAPSCPASPVTPPVVLQRKRIHNEQETTLESASPQEPNKSKRVIKEITLIESLLASCENSCDSSDCTFFSQ